MNVYKDYRIYKDEDDKDKLKDFKDNAYKTRISFIYNKKLGLRIIWLKRYYKFVYSYTYLD